MTDTQKIHRFAEQNMLVERYLLNELKDADLEDFEQHLFECSICFDQVKAGQALAQRHRGRAAAMRLHAMAMVAADEGMVEQVMQFDFTSLFVVFFAGMAFGCILMAVLQRQAAARKEKEWRAEYQALCAAKFPPRKVVEIAPKREVRR